MRLLARFAAALLLALLPPLAAVQAQTGTAARSQTEREAIERILEADNLDSSQLSARDVVGTIVGIPRGRAPDDFWQAYQAHVAAWRRLADIEDRVVRQQGESTFVEGEQELVAAGRAVDSTFEEVVRIARRYGARIPVAPGETIPTV